MTDGGTRIMWIPGAGFDPACPTLAGLGAGIDLSAYVTTVGWEPRERVGIQIQLRMSVGAFTVGMIRMSKALKALISAVRRPGRVSAMHRAYRTKTRRRNRRTGHGTR